jgi:hypothetical protein
MSANKFAPFNTIEGFQEILCVNSRFELDHILMCQNLMDCLKQEYVPKCYTDTNVLDDYEPDETEEFSFYWRLNKGAIALFQAYNYRVFRLGDLDALDELLMVRCDKPYEKYIKFLATLMLNQEFLGLRAAVEFSTDGDYWRYLENPSVLSKEFMNIYVVHYLYHTKFKDKNILSLFQPKTIASDAKYKKTLLFGQALSSNFSSIINSDHFDEFYKPFFEAWAKLKGCAPGEMELFVGASVTHGTHMTNPIARKIRQALRTDNDDE